MRLFFLSAGTVLVVALVLAIFRFWGLGQSYPQYPLGFFNQDLPLVGTHYNAPSAQEYKLWWVDVQLKEQVLLTSESTSLEELLKENKDRFFILNINENVENIHLKVADLISSLRMSKQVLIQSDYKNIIYSLRERVPTAAYGSSLADLTKLKVYQSLWILPAATMNGDALIVPLYKSKRRILDQELVDEIHRRGKKVIVAPLVDASEIDEIKKMGVDGWIVPTLR